MDCSNILESLAMEILDKVANIFLSIVGGAVVSTAVYAIFDVANHGVNDLEWGIIIFFGLAGVVGWLYFLKRLFG